MVHNSARRRLASRPVASTTILVSIAIAVLTFTVPAQLAGQIQLGDHASGSINVPVQTDLWVLAGTMPGDRLVLTFCSAGYAHQLEVVQSGSPIGSISGFGSLQVSGPANLIRVRAIDNQSVGWYAFQVDRLNSPVKADRIAFAWTIGGTLSKAAEFAVYTLSAGIHSSVQLNFVSAGFAHYAEIFDSLGVSQAVAVGNMNVAFNFPTSGTYTLLVAAANYQSVGWYSVSVDCSTWPGTPCGYQAYTGNYGQGFPGTNGVPSLSSSPPTIGMPLTFNIGNSENVTTTGFLLLGPSSANTPTAFGGTILVAATAVIGPITVPVGGTTYTLPIPNLQALLGFAIAWQSILASNGATFGAAFSPGLATIF